MSQPPTAAEQHCQVPDEHGQPICVRSIGQATCQTCPDTRISVAANALGWARRHHERARDDDDTITVTAAEAAEDLEIARRVVEHLDGWDAKNPRQPRNSAPVGLDVEQAIRHHALATAVEWFYVVDAASESALFECAELFAAYIRDGSRPA